MKLIKKTKLSIFTASLLLGVSGNLSAKEIVFIDKSINDYEVITQVSSTR